MRVHIHAGGAPQSIYWPIYGLSIMCPKPSLTYLTYFTMRIYGPSASHRAIHLPILCAEHKSLASKEQRQIAKRPQMHHHIAVIVTLYIVYTAFKFVVEF